MSELVYRMRTCSAAIKAQAGETLPHLYRDAADLLEEASNLLEVEAAPQQLMKLIESPPPPPPAPLIGVSWIGADLPAASPRACPVCSSTAPKTAHKLAGKLFLICPVCTTRWEYMP